MKILFTLAFLLSLTGHSEAQTITRSVLSSAGGSQAAQGVTLDYTLGEPAAGYAAPSGGTTIVAGFQQPFSRFPVSVIGAEPIEIAGVTAYPNPTVEKLNVTLLEPIQHLTISIWTIDGRQKPASPVKISPAEYVVVTAHLPAGVYVLHLFDPARNATQTLLFNKAN